ncbi:hypothetical protein MIR68_009826 [Amoeboaphelidium protococcarum]|nr:hypothetical protein MIR68_009826 [Amoeboaphelidium protococcarum]
MTYTQQEIDIIERAWNFELSWKDIGFLLEKSGEAVRSKYKRLREEADLGEKPIISKRLQQGNLTRALKSILSQNKYTAYRDIPALLKQAGFQDAEVPSPSTIRNMMKDLGFECRIMVQRQFMNSVNQQKRFQFAKEYLSKEDWRWDLVIWSDETLVKQAPNNQDIVCWTRNGRIDPSESETSSFNRVDSASCFGAALASTDLDLQWWLMGQWIVNNT